MAALNRLVALAGLLIAQPANAQPAKHPAVQTTADPGGRHSADPAPRWHVYIAAASDRFGIPARWIERVMRAESGGATTLDGAPITSPVGAMGLMQLMPKTWAVMRATYRLGADPYDPHDNIIAGAAYLRAMYDRFGYPGLFGAYNAGPGRYAAYLAGARALPAETRRYLAAVTATPAMFVAPKRSAASERLFARREPAREAAQAARSIPCESVLFALEDGRACAH